MGDQRRLLTIALQNALLAAIYFLMGQFGHALAFQYKIVSVVWPPAGIALAAILIFGNRLAPGVFVGATLINYVVSKSWVIALGIGIGNTLEALVAAWLLNRIFNFDRALNRISDVLGLIFGGAWLSTMLSATICAGILIATREIAPSEFTHAWYHRWLGDALSILLLTPTLLVLNAKTSRRQWFASEKGVRFSPLLLSWSSR